MIERIDHCGKLIDDCTLPGERRADQVAPAHGNGIQLSEDRFLLLNSTLRFRGVDDNTSIVWQLRKGGYDGPVIKEGLFARSINDWYPLGDKYRCVKQHGHPVAFGVPKGALIGGKPAPHANVFAVKWRKRARVFVPEGGYLMWQSEPSEVRARTQCVEWCQFRLNDTEDDIEILQPARELRQLGYEAGEEVADHGLAGMNQSFVQPVPFNDAGTEWVDVNHFPLGGDVGAQSIPLAAGAISRLAALRYRFDAVSGLYQWVETSAPFGERLFEASIAPWGSSWVIAGRRIGRDPGIGWVRVQNPFQETPELDIIEPPSTRGCPLSVYRCPDGVIRLLTGDGTISPHGSNRNPLYLWEIDVDAGFRAGEPREIFDTYGAGVPIEKDHGPLIDMAKLLPHAGGNTQTLIHRVRTCAMAVKEADYPSRIRPLTDGDFHGTAIYYAKVHYQESYPGTWEFSKKRQI